MDFKSLPQLDYAAGQSCKPSHLLTQEIVSLLDKGVSTKNAPDVLAKGLFSRYFTMDKKVEVRDPS